MDSVSFTTGKLADESFTIQPVTASTNWWLLLLVGVGIGAVAVYYYKK